MMGLATITARLLRLASLFHRWTIILFGYFVPALSSVKAVVHRDPESFFQWSTYWLILHLYSTILSPVLHLTLHPVFQLIAVLWLSLPRFQGATAVYERVVVPWVRKYENRVDDAIDEAHRGVTRWVWGRLGYVTMSLVGESGALLEVLLELIFGKPSQKKNDAVVADSNTADAPSESRTQAEEMRVDTSQSHLSSISSSNTTEEKQQRQQQPQPRHSVRDALRQSSTLQDFVVVDDDDNVEHSAEFMAEYVRDFKSMMSLGLYVFARAIVKEEEQRDKTADGSLFNDDNNNNNDNNNDFRLGVFSYDAHSGGGVFSIAPVGTQDNNNSTYVTTLLPIYGLAAPSCSGSQSILLEWRGDASAELATTIDTAMTEDEEDDATVIRITKVEIVLSNEDDRDILFHCLTKCLPWMRA